MHTMSGGRSRRKKLVRSKRLSKTDSEVEQENINGAAAAADSAANQELLEAEAAEAGSEQPPPLETVSESSAAPALIANILQLENSDAELAGMYIFPNTYIFKYCEGLSEKCF